MSTELRRLAAAATPGPWFAQPTEHEPPRGMVYGPDGDSMFDIEWNPGNDYDPIATAEYVAACSPDVITALLDERDAAALRESGLDNLLIDARTERDMLDVAYTDLRRAALRVIEATQPVDRDAAILDLECVVHNGEPYGAQESGSPE